MSTMSKVAEDYGYQLAFLKSNSELYNVFKKAVNGGWDATRFVAAVRKTTWYRTHSEMWRNNQQLKYSDPRTYKEKLNASTAEVRSVAASMGLTLSSKTFDRLAMLAFQYAWTSTQIREQLAREMKPGNVSRSAGLVASTEDALFQTAWRNGVNVSNEFVTSWAKKIALGQATTENAQQWIRDHYAKSVAPGFAKQLEAGQDLYDLATPYMQSMAKTLELNPADIDLFDPKIRQALASSSNKDGQVGSVPLWQFEKELKQDPRWLKTNNARDQLDQTTRNLSKMFGVGV